MEDEFVEFQRIVVGLSDFELPGGDLLAIVQYMLEAVEIDQWCP